jgi:hypothetical protein
MSAGNGTVAAHDDAPEDVFLSELLRKQEESLRKQNALLRELLEVLRDVRDELAYLREQRTKR